jgi:hypothetical protein
MLAPKPHRGEVGRRRVTGHDRVDDAEGHGRELAEENGPGLAEDAPGDRHVATHRSALPVVQSRIFVDGSTIKGSSTKMIRVFVWSLPLVIATASWVFAAASFPPGFCGCPEHKPTETSARATAGQGYRLNVFNDAYLSDGKWCYTRAVWSEAVRVGGRFEWWADRHRVMSGAIAPSRGPCGSYQNHYESTASPLVRFSQVRHGATMNNKTDIRLFYAASDEFRPGWQEPLLKRLSSLFGFVQYPPAAGVTAVSIKLASVVRGNAAPYDIEYSVEANGLPGLTLYRPGRDTKQSVRYPRLYWEAAISKEG